MTNVVYHGGDGVREKRFNKHSAGAAYAKVMHSGNKTTFKMR